LRVVPALCADSSSHSLDVTSNQDSGESTGATAAATGRAGKAMNAGLNRALVQIIRCDVPQVKRFAVGHLHIEHLIEVAIVKLAAIADAQGGAAHEAVHRRRIEAVGEQFQILIPFALFAEIFGEAGNRLVGEGVKVVEDNSEVAS